MANRSQTQVVRLTRCLDVPGHTAMLVRVMIEIGYRLYGQDIPFLSWSYRTPPLLLWTWGYHRDVRAGRSLLDDDYHTSQNCLASEH